MLTKVKSINELFTEAKDFDLVITSDAPLATALNKLVEKPRLGYLAMTPKQIAAKFAQLYYEKLYEKFDVVLRLSRITNKPVKLIHHSVEKIYEIWMYNAKLEFTEQFLSNEELSLIKHLKEIETIETAMENFNEEFYGDKSIAVIGEELFSLLDLEVLPKRGAPAKKIEIFKEGEFKIDKTYIFPSAEQLVNNILKLINSENADQTAIVLDSRSDHLEILKARFKDAGIKIEIKNYLSDEMSVRNIISLIELSFRVNELKVGEFLPLAVEFQIPVDIKYRHYDLSNFMKQINNDKKLEKLYDFSRNIVNLDYKNLLKELKTDFNFDINKEFTELLELLEYNESKITESNLIDLKYFLKEFNIEINSEKSGVLFVNAQNSAFIDRQIIFYLGLDNTWMTLFPDKEYLNKEEEESKNLKRFQILIQQGKKRFYFVQNIIDYKEVLPCYYFMTLSGIDTESFLNDYFNPVRFQIERSSNEYKGNKRKSAGQKKEVLSALSPSSLNKYFKCPKLYSINKLLPDEDLPVFKKGTLLHEFAELYFHHPEFTNDKFQKVLELMVKKMSVFLNNNNEEYIKSGLKIGMDSIKKFIDERSIKKSLLPFPKEADKNELMADLKKDRIYSNTENWLTDKDITHITGKIDLQYENNIIDYKSSNERRTESKVTLQSNLDYINLNESDDFDFQAISYITSKSREFREVNFIYNYILNNYKYQIDEKQKEDKNLTHIKYIPLTFNEYIYSEKAFDIIKSDKIGEKLLGILGYENYKHVLDNLNLSSNEYFDKEILNNKIIEVTNSVISDLGMSFNSFGNKKQETFNENLRKTLSRYIYNFRTGAGETGMLYKDDVEKFKGLVNNKLTEMNKYLNSSFPFEPVFGSREICRFCDYLNLCTGNKLWH